MDIGEVLFGANGGAVTKRLLHWIAVAPALLGAGVVLAVSPGTITSRGEVPVAGTGARGPIGHVAMYVGGGNIIDAPQTGQPVKIEPLSSHAHYAGARYYL